MIEVSRSDVGGERGDIAREKEFGFERRGVKVICRESKCTGLGNFILYSVNHVIELRRGGGGYREFVIREFLTCDGLVLFFEHVPVFVNLCDIAQSVFVVFYCGGRIHDLSDKGFFAGGTDNCGHGLFVGYGCSIG